jgi:hypothetical protein
MPTKIDAVGTFIGEIVESGVGTTKAGKPQWVTRLKAVKKYITSPEDLAHFKAQGVITEEVPQYVDWTPFDEDIVGFLMLYNSTDVFDDTTKMMNYDQLQIATGWEGTSFDALADGSLLNKQILFRVQDKKPYIKEGTQTLVGEGELEIGWIDAADAAPERQLKTLEPDAIAALNAKLKIAPKAKPVAAPAKPAAAKPGKPPAATKPAAPVATAPAQSAPPVATPPVVPAPVPTSPTTTSPSNAAPKPPKAPKKPAAPAAPVAEAKVYPAETTQMDAWNAAIAANPGGDDTKLTDAWIKATQLVGGERDDDTFTPAEWAAVRDAVFVELKK